MNRYQIEDGEPHHESVEVALDSDAIVEDVHRGLWGQFNDNISTGFYFTSWKGQRLVLTKLKFTWAWILQVKSHGLVFYK